MMTFSFCWMLTKYQTGINVIIKILLISFEHIAYYNCGFVCFCWLKQGSAPIPEALRRLSGTDCLDTALVSLRVLLEAEGGRQRRGDDTSRGRLYDADDPRSVRRPSDVAAPQLFEPGSALEPTGRICRQGQRGCRMEYRQSRILRRISLLLVKTRYVSLPLIFPSKIAEIIKIITNRYEWINLEDSYYTRIIRNLFSYC